MKKVRVYELARELSLSSEALVKMLREMDGVTVKSHMSTVDEGTVTKLKDQLTKRREAVRKETERKQKMQAEIARKQTEPKPGDPARRDKRRRRGRRRRQVDQAAVQKSVKETLATMGGGSKGRKRRKEVRQAAEGTPSKVKVTEFITLGELANLFRQPATELMKQCLALGIMANINKRLDKDVIELLAGELGVEVEFGEEFGADIVEEIRQEEEDVTVETRAPVVTIMGHVDHGKTSLLDYIRKAQVAAGEAGGITQHIGAYSVTLDRGRIVFLDTPGHEAFTAMRARGAEATDIVVLVVAANDGAMPQTLEAISHAKAAKVPIVVAVNKIDLPDANPDKVRQDLSQRGLIPEAWGGETIFVDISAKTGQNVEQLLEMILLVAEMRDLKASSERLCRGTVVEAHVDRGRGTVATVLVQDGTLSVGDAFVCGSTGGRVRALADDRGKRIESAGPAHPVEVLGWADVPNAGDEFQVLKDEQQAREIVTRRQQISREQKIRRQTVVSLANLHDQIREGEIQDLNVIVKADTQGSVEVLCDSFEKLSNDEVRVRIIHRGVGNVNENDVLLAAASRALVFGFHVKKGPKAMLAAEREKVDVNMYSVIYEAVNDLKAAMEGMLKPEEVDHVRGHAEVRQLFKIPKAGVIAGSYVSSGIVQRNMKARVLRDGEVIHVGKVGSLKRFKDDVKEVEAGLECGISLESFDKLQAGDIIELFETEQVLRKIS